jgi:hypothetical protein
MTHYPLARRGVLISLICGGLVGCGLAERPFLAQRRWPLQLQRPVILPLLPGGKIIEMRAIVAGPGLESDALQSLQPDGSLLQQSYERWVVPPADGVGGSLRLWLAQSGRFGGVVDQGSRAHADVALEAELTVLLCDLRTQAAQATMSLAAIDLRQPARTVLLQIVLTGTAKLTDASPAGQVQAQLSALTALFEQIEHVVPQ